jgi:hypothetical protein
MAWYVPQLEFNGVVPQVIFGPGEKSSVLKAILEDIGEIQMACQEPKVIAVGANRRQEVAAAAYDAGVRGQVRMLWGLPVAACDKVPPDEIWVGLDTCDHCRPFGNILGGDYSRRPPLEWTAPPAVHTADKIGLACALIGFEPEDVKAVRIWEDVTPTHDHLVIAVDVANGWQPVYEFDTEELRELDDYERCCLTAAFGLDPEAGDEAGYSDGKIITWISEDGVEVTVRPNIQEFSAWQSRQPQRREALRGGIIQRQIQQGLMTPNQARQQMASLPMTFKALESRMSVLEASSRKAQAAMTNAADAYERVAGPRPTLEHYDEAPLWTPDKVEEDPKDWARRAMFKIRVAFTNWW